MFVKSISRKEIQVNITADDLRSWDYGELDHLSYMIKCEKDRRRIESYPDEWTRIFHEGIDGYDADPLHKRIDEYTKIVGEYNSFVYIEDVTERLNIRNEHVVRVKYKDPEGDNSWLDIPLEHLKNLDLAKEEIAKKEENQRKLEIERLEKHILKLREQLDEKKLK
jgi:hypothetical protein